MTAPVASPEDLLLPGPKHGNAKSYRLALPPVAARKLDADRDLGHRAVMGLLPDGLGPHPRAASGTIWRVDVADSVLHLITRAPVAGYSTDDATHIETVTAGERVTIHAELETTYAKTAPIRDEVLAALRAAGITAGQRSPICRVTDDDLPAWIERKLQRNGFTTGAIASLQRRRATRRGAPMHLVNITADVQVHDVGLANAALVGGISRGRSFGAGMVTLAH